MSSLYIFSFSTTYGLNPTRKLRVIRVTSLGGSYRLLAVISMKDPNVAALVTPRARDDSDKRRQGG